MHLALICLLIFLIGQSHGTGLKELYENQKTDMELQWKKEWSNFTENNPYILAEYIKPIDDNKTDQENTNKCHDQLNFQIMKLTRNSVIENSFCRLEKLGSYTDFIDSIINGFNSSSYESCYKNKYLVHEMLQCIDDISLYADSFTQKNYQRVYNLVKQYNDILTASMKNCVSNFEFSLKKSMNESDIQFEKCEKILKEEILKKNCKKLQLDSNVVYLYESYKELLFLMENKTQKIIQRIYKEEFDNYQNGLYYSKNHEKVTCCFRFSMDDIYLTMQKTLNQSKQCFQLKQLDLQKFIIEFIKDRKKIFRDCNNDNLSLELSLMCFYRVLNKNCTESVESKYEILLKTVKNHNEQLPSSIRPCLYKAINELRQSFVALKKKHINCINNKIWDDICVKKPFKYDSNTMNVDSLYLYINKIVTDIINAYQ